MNQNESRNVLLKGTSKGSLVLVSWFVIPLGYVIILSIMALIGLAIGLPEIECPPYPQVVLMMVSLVIALACLVVSHLAVNRELARRKGVPSDLRRALVRMAVFVGLGLGCWLVLFYGILSALVELTAVRMESAYEIAAILPFGVILPGGLLLAWGKTARGGRSREEE